MDKTYAGMSYEEVVEKYSDYITRMCRGRGGRKTAFENGKDRARDRAPRGGAPDDGLFSAQILDRHG